MAKDEEIIRTSLRLPKTLYDRLEKAAVGKTMHAEIIQRLEDSFSGRFERVDRENAGMGRRLASIERTLDKLMSRVSEERVRLDAIQKHPERMSPEDLRAREGAEAYQRDPEGEYFNPYERGTPHHYDFMRGYRDAAVRAIPDGDEEAIVRLEKAVGPVRINRAIFNAMAKGRIAYESDPSGSPDNPYASDTPEHRAFLHGYETAHWEKTHLPDFSSSTKGVGVGNRSKPNSRE